MKKIIVLIACVAATGVASAQSGFSFGVKGGVNIASMVGAGTDEARSKPGPYLGGMIEYDCCRELGIQAEVLYSRQGMWAAETDGSFAISASLDNHYVVVPLLMKVRVLPNLSVDFGPQFGLLLAAKARSTQQDYYYGDQITDSTTDAHDKMCRTELSLPMGATYKIGSTGLQVGARYVMGLTNITKK
ncbi:MAG: PorT family protein [Rikenellaceae bacterium]|jgi:hypothetical protein|nr:PorT family protein [Rikenellaceae bacterium]